MKNDTSDMQIGLLEQGHFEFLDSPTPTPPLKPKKAKAKTKMTDEPAKAEPLAQKNQLKALVSSRTGKARVFRGKKHVISVSIAPHVLSRVDEWAAKKGMSRPAAIAFALNLLPD